MKAGSVSFFSLGQQGDVLYIYIYIYIQLSTVCIPICDASLNIQSMAIFQEPID